MLLTTYFRPLIPFYRPLVAIPSFF